MPTSWNRFSSGVVAALALLAAGSSCGSEDSEPTASETPRTDVEQIADVYARWASAVDNTQFEDACALQSQALQDHMAAEAKRILDESAGLDPEIADLRPTCAFYLEGASPMEPPDIDIDADSIEVTGAKASATVGLDTWRFVKESGGWRISHLD